MSRYTTDILVIGSGLAGCAAALAVQPDWHPLGARNLFSKICMVVVVTSVIM